MNEVWCKLEKELSKWSDQSIYPIFWIRDDDAYKETQKLTRLISFTKEFNIPISLAVIPFLIEKSLVKILNSIDLISILQHGFKHKNYEPNGQKKSEFGESRNIGHMLEDIHHGAKLVSEYFERAYQPIFVPPWNRMSHLLLPHINCIGITAVSSFKKNLCGHATNIEYSKIINTNIDIIYWKKNKVFAGEKDLVDQLIFELKVRRENNSRIREPIGILTHHNVMNEDSFLFLDKLIRITIKSGSQWHSIKKIIQ